LRVLLGALVAVVALAVGSGCGTGGPAHGGNITNGKDLFTGDGRCGGCHTLAAAGSRGTVGPNLDDAFRRSRENGFKESTIQNVVLDQIRFPTSGSGMPANLVEGQDAKDVSAFVAQCAANEKDKAACPGVAAGGGGKGLYAALGCQGCHTLDGTRSSGPTFKGLYGSTVTLTNGQKVKADDAYLLESILDPDKQIVKGYQPGVMSATIKPGSVAQAQAKQLVEFIKSAK
jgi:cytochrome c2